MTDNERTNQHDTDDAAARDKLARELLLGEEHTGDLAALIFADDDKTTHHRQQR